MLFAYHKPDTHTDTKHKPAQVLKIWISECKITMTMPLQDIRHQLIMPLQHK